MKDGGRGETHRVRWGGCDRVSNISSVLNSRKPSGKGAIYDHEQLDEVEGLLIS